MHRIFVSAIAAAGLSLGLNAAASSADLESLTPAPAPVYTKAPVVAPWSWTGFYIGGNVGYGSGAANSNLSATQVADPDVTDTLAASDSAKMGGVIGGEQLGFNWQARNLLFGIESDIQLSGQKGSNSYSATIIDPISPKFNNPVEVTDSSKLAWFGTARGRFGVTSDRWLVYATGGLAYGEVKESGNALPANGLAFVSNAPFVWDQSTLKAGWTIGAGVENAISANWSWKIEYLYMDLGSITSNVSGGIGSEGGNPANCYGGFPACRIAAAPASGTVTSRFTDNIVRVGINYKLN
jgi:outer membrane immunogenic protein